MLKYFYKLLTGDSLSWHYTFVTKFELDSMIDAFETIGRPTRCADVCPLHACTPLVSSIACPHHVAPDRAKDSRLPPKGAFFGKFSKTFRKKFRRIFQKDFKKFLTVFQRICKKALCEQ